MIGSIDKTRPRYNIFIIKPRFADNFQTRYQMLINYFKLNKVVDRTR